MSRLSTPRGLAALREKLAAERCRMADSPEVDIRKAGIRKAMVLLQVNISAEPQKHGIEPHALRSMLSRAAEFSNVEVLGLMGMGPLAVDPETCRPLFRGLRELRDEANAGGWYRAPLGELSMGMSNDFEVAVEEGATILRVGTALFTGLDPDEPGSLERASEER